jgi:hypothetical protein
MIWRTLSFSVLRSRPGCTDRNHGIDPGCCGHLWPRWVVISGTYARPCAYFWQDSSRSLYGRCVVPWNTFISSGVYGVNLTITRVLLLNELTLCSKWNFGRYLCLLSHQIWVLARYQNGLFSRTCLIWIPVMSVGSQCVSPPGELGLTALRKAATANNWIITNLH